MNNKNMKSKKIYLYIHLLSIFITFACHSDAAAENITYYLYISDFAKSFISIPTANVSVDSTTLDSSYLAGRAPIYNEKNIPFGTCSASFLSMQTSDGIFTDIANYLAADNGLIVTWFTPTKLLNLELDSIIHGMVTECIVTVTTKIGFSPFYGQTFNLVVSSDNEKIYFKFTSIESDERQLSSTARTILLKYCPLDLSSISA